MCVSWTWGMTSNHSKSRQYSLQILHQNALGQPGCLASVASANTLLGEYFAIPAEQWPAVLVLPACLYLKEQPVLTIDFSKVNFGRLGGLYACKLTQASAWDSRQQCGGHQRFKCIRGRGHVNWYLHSQPAGSCMECHRGFLRQTDRESRAPTGQPSPQALIYTHVSTHSS